MATPEKVLNPNEKNDRLWRSSELNQSGVSDDSREAYRQAAELRHSPRSVNVNDTERIISGIGGGALAAYGIARTDLLGLGLAAVGAALVYRGVTGHCDIYAAGGMNTAAKENFTSVKAGAGVKVEKSVTINAPVEELYQFWRKFENLPQIMKHLESVTEIDQMKSHWKAKAPLGQTVEWDAEIISDIPNNLISWRSVENSDIANAGSIRFLQSTGGRGTVVKVSINYEPPAGKLGAAIAWLFGEEPSVQIRDDLRRFKNLMESGEIPTIEGQSSGRTKSKTSYDLG